LSFTCDVKDEILKCINDKDKKFACLYGMILYSRILEKERICFQTESRVSAYTFISLFRNVFHIELSYTEHFRKDLKTLYCFEITDPEIIEKVYRVYKINCSERRIEPALITMGSMSIFTAGVFLACGSLNNPEKEYHLEFAVPAESLEKDIVSVLGSIGVSAKTVERRGQIIVYVKDSESIEDILTFMGAQQCTLQLINIEIFKDMRNKANRIRNCDTANIEKTVKASISQINDIELIAETKGLESLSKELREVAEFRLKNADMSLKEIGESLSQPISRSGVNHRFRKISRIAEEIRGNNGKQ